MTVTEEQVKTAAKAAQAELMAMAKEMHIPTKYTEIISIGNYRVMRAAISAAMAVGAGTEMGVRPLEWTLCGNGISYAETVVGKYRAHIGGWRLGEGYSQGAPSLDEAKAAAQADYERRIRSALLPAGKGEGWRDMSSAPKDGTEIILRVPCKGFPDHYKVIGHWAQDLSGSEQPPFRGWFRNTGYGFVEIDGPTGWMSLPKAEGGE